ncbi:MAG TPA: DUF2079 domain-containing protein [Acidimicrobiales bacterium]|nr:DUF2079 domain-containing protein [Acidimicrobiales bacterium]
MDSTAQVTLAMPATGTGPLRTEAGIDAAGWARRVGWVALALQGAGMLALSTVQYGRDALTNDFGGYAQGWWAIAHGNLDPWSTLWNVALWKNNGEFLLWPLAVAYPVVPHPAGLLWIQDAVVVLTEVVAFRWVLAALDRARGLARPLATVITLGTAVLLVANPWAWETIAFDVHFEPVAGLFALLAAYDLWQGRTRRLWWWVPLCLLADALGGLYVAGVGLSGILAGRTTRRPAVLLGVVGLAWFTLMSAIGGAGVGGHTAATAYGYLLGGHPARANALDIVLGILGHPGAVVSHLASRWAVALDFLLPAGLIGVASPWGVGMVLAAFVPAMLAGNLLFFRPVAAFQVWPALPFVLVGTVLVLLRLATHEPAPSRGWSPRLGLAALALWAPLAAGRTAAAFPIVPATALAVGATTGAQVATVAASIPADAEVIASEGVVGRFSTRRYAYHLDESDHRFAVHGAPVYVVLTPGQGLGPISLREANAVVAFVTDRLGGHLVSRRDGVTELAWRPVPGVRRVVLP